MTSEMERRPRSEPGRGPAEPTVRIPVERVEPVLRRAIELDAAEEAAETLSLEALEAVAIELGIDPASVRRAVAEERVRRPAAPADVWDRLLGRDDVEASVVVPGTRSEVLTAAEAWLRRHEGLRRKHGIGDGSVWTRDASLVTRIRRSLGLSRGSGALRLAREVELSVVPVDETTQILVLRADGSPLQRLGRWLLGGVAALVTMVTISSVATAGTAGLGALAGAVLALPVIVGIRAATGRLADGVVDAVRAVAGGEGTTQTELDRIVAAGSRWLESLRELFGRRA